MTLHNRPYIVLIDDDVKSDQPLVGYLKKEYPIDNIFLFQNPADGVKFIEENLEKKIIVLLDIMFYGKPLGFEVFNQIIDKSSLVCFIVMSGNIEKSSYSDLVSLINGHAWYIVQRDKPAKDILSLVKQAENHLSMRIDSAIEEWVLRQNPENMQKNFIKSRNGKSYTLLDILHSIRTGTDPIGQEMANDILQLAITMISEDESLISD